jgi:hypothetical protein
VTRIEEKGGGGSKVWGARDEGAEVNEWTNIESYDHLGELSLVSGLVGPLSDIAIAGPAPELSAIAPTSAESCHHSGIICVIESDRIDRL